MKAPDDHYDFDKETPDGRPIKIFDLDEKPPKKKPSPWRDSFFWVVFVLFFGGVIGFAFWLPYVFIPVLIIVCVFILIGFFAKVGSEFLSRL